MWWDYVKKFQLCLNKKLSKPGQLDCYEGIAGEISLDEDIQQKISDCFSKSFDDKDDPFLSDNSILKDDQFAYPSNMSYTIPIVTLNNNLLRESWNEDTMTSAVCDQLLQPPSSC